MTQVTTQKHSAFSPARFGKYFGAYLSINRTQLVLGASLLLASLLIFTALTLVFSIEEYLPAKYPRTSDPLDEVMRAIYYITFFIGLCLTASFMFSFLHGRRQSFNALVLPASRFEKWLTVFTIYIIGYWLLFIVEMCLTEYIRAAVVFISGLDTSGLYHFISPWSLIDVADDEECTQRALVFVMFLSVPVILQSLFALGSIYFRRFSFIITGIALSILSFVVPMITAIVILTAFQSDIDPRFAWMDDLKVLLVMYTIFFVVSTAVSYALGYWRYRQTEIINKW